MSLLPEINQASAEINKFVAQANIHQTIAPVNPAAFTDPADTALLASRDPVIREVSVGMTGEAYSDYTVSGTPPLSLPNSLGEPLKSWSVDVLPYQEGTGDPSPSNVRPIHGTDKLTITTAGKNLLPTMTADDTNGLTNTVNADGSIHVAGTATGSGGYITEFVNLPLTIKSGEIFTVCVSNNVPSKLRLFFDSATADIQSGNNSVTTSLNTNITKLRFYLFTTADTEYDFTIYPQLELGSAPSDYTPYLAPSQTVLTLPQTVYTGTIGSEGGESRTKMVVLDGNLSPDDIGVTLADNYTQISYVPYISEGVAGHNFMSNIFKPVNSGGLYRIWGTTVPRMFLGLPTSVTSREEAVAWFADNPTQIVYPLATPTTFAITAPTIPTPTGTATTWATAEDGTVDGMEVTYIKSE